MLQIKCAWCSAVSQLAEENEMVTDVSRYLCPPCLISLLPKTLLMDESSDEAPVLESERRRHERYPVLSNVYLSSRSNRNKVIKILVLDISEAGMKIQIMERLEANEEITLGFMGKQIVYKAIGLVKRMEEVLQDQKTYYRLGIRLTGIHQDLRHP